MLGLDPDILAGDDAALIRLNDPLGKDRVFKIDYELLIFSMGNFSRFLLLL